MASPRNRFSCYRCYDNENTREFCGDLIKNVVECPRASQNSNYCQNAHISNAIIGTFTGNNYTMQPGNTCMIKISNIMSLDTVTDGFWKIWKDDQQMKFYIANSLSETDDNNLEGIT
mmetsp:Transcript_9289/g.15639  ORF Transcript_9289/g.15639 Transcript_9289/m.15639 type:complete len:117 (+) Transcript_9289:106-456(+)